MECLRISQFRRRWLLVAAFGAILLMTSTSAMATLLPVPPAPAMPGDLVVPPDVAGDNPGTLLAKLSEPFTATAGQGTGTIISAVFRESDGFLDFYYQVINDPTSASNITTESDINFTGFSTDVPWGLAYRSDATTMCAIAGANCTTNGPNPFTTNGTIAPTLAQRNSDGLTVTFNFNAPNQIIPGTTSNVLVISTNATTFGFGNASVINGGTATVLSFAPAPEPASLALIGGGLLLLAGVRKFAKKH